MYTMHNVSLRLIILLVVAFLFQFTLSAQAAGEYPTRPIELLFGWAAGGTADIRARALLPKIGEVLGQPVAILYKTGAVGTIAATIVSQAKPDGYTIGYVTGSTVVTAPHMQKVPFDPLTSFTYIAGTTAQPYAFVVRSDAPWKTMGEFIDYAKKNPGEVKYGSSGIGGIGHLYAEMFARAMDLKIVNVPFKGDHEVTTALLGGHISITAPLGGFTMYIKGGKMRALGVFAEDRMVDFPHVPTMKELGFPYDTRAGEINCFWGPKGLPPEILKKLENAVRQAVETPEHKALMVKMDMVIRFRDSQEFTKLIHEVYPQTGEIIRLLGLSKPSP